MQVFFSRWVFVALGLAVALGACSKTDATAASKAAAKGSVLTVATSAAYAPFESLTPDGQIVGFDVDLVKAVASKAGLQVKFVNTPWAEVFKSLETGKSDLVASGVTITPVRMETMDFSDPYFAVEQKIVVIDDSKIGSLADLKAPGVTVGVQSGTTGDEVASNLLGKTSPAIKRFDSAPQTLTALETGAVTAVVVDDAIAQHHIQTNAIDNFQLVDILAFTPERYGIVIKKGNDALLKKVNDALKAIRKDGTYDTLYAKWFGNAK